MSTESNKRIAKNTLFMYLRMLITMVVTLYTSRIVLNTLGENDFGIYNLIGGIVTFFAFLARHSEREIFPQDVERRFGVTRSTSSRVLGLMERKGLIVRESVRRDARLKKIVLTDKSRDIAEALRENAVAMESILLQGLNDDDIRQFMHVLDVMQSNLVETGMIGDEKRYSSLAICDVRADESQAENEGKEEE